jgi:cobyrinic acid a,c-diamide synthase
MKGVIIAGVSSDSGKTTLTLGILRALKNKGYAVQPFKIGPDYIDPMFHGVAAGKVSYNLDAFLVCESILKDLYFKHMQSAQVGIIEGVMGLYDGLNTTKDSFSSAHLSKILNVPVILVVDAKGMAASASALVLGFKQYDPDVTIAGVILNRLGSEYHYALIKEAIERDTGIPCIGWLPRQDEPMLESRHLGLIPVDECPELDADLEKLAKLVEAYIDLEFIAELEQLKKHIEVEDTTSKNTVLEGCIPELKGKKIGVFKDKAFNFYYQDNLDFLVNQGAQLIMISPLNDAKLTSCDALYIGGGYPEVFKEHLSANQSFMSSLKTALDHGLPAYAECGGMMYLTKSIDGVEMVGFFEDNTVMTQRLVRFGYVNLQVRDLDKKSTLSTKAHEFHFSDVTQEEKLPYLFEVSRPSKPQKKWYCGRKKHNTIGSYPHIHFYSNPEIVRLLFSI